MRWSRQQLESKLAALEPERRTLVLPHDFPDPDALAGAAGIARLLEVTRRHEVMIGFGGFIGRAENQVLSRVLGVPLRVTEQLNFDDYDYVAMVDTQPQAGNNSLPPDLVPAIVVDHHPLVPATAQVAWADVRVDFGASVTIILEYLRLMGIPLGPRLATGCYYALKSETRDLVRETNDEDLEAFQALFPHIDRDRLAGILHPPLPADYFRLLSRAVERSRIYESLLVVDLLSVPFPEMVAEVADLMLRHEGVFWVLSVGQFANALFFSLRTRNGEDRHAGDVLAEVVGSDGKAGGHGTMAGGRIQVSDVREARAMAKTVAGRLQSYLGLDDAIARSIGSEPPLQSGPLTDPNFRAVGDEPDRS